MASHRASHPTPLNTWCLGAIGNRLTMDATPSGNHHRTMLNTYRCPHSSCNLSPIPERKMARSTGTLRQPKNHPLMVFVAIPGVAEGCLGLAGFFVQFFTTLHYTTLHYTTLHYTTLHYTTLHYTTLHYTTLHYTTLHYTTLHYTTLHYTTLHYTTLHYTTLHYTTLHYTTLHYTTLHYTTPHHTTPHHTTPHHTTPHHTTLHLSIFFSFCSDFTDFTGVAVLLPTTSAAGCVS